MSVSLLTKIRKLNWVLSESATGYFSFNDLCGLLAEMMETNVYLLNAEGKNLGAKYKSGEEFPTVEGADGTLLPLEKKYNDLLLELKETKMNITEDDVRKIYGNDYLQANKFHVIVPVIFGGKRISTLVLARHGVPFSEEEVAIIEYGATVIGLEVSRGIAMEKANDERYLSMVKMALETLSFSELDAVVKIFAELEGKEGILVASKIADKSGITRSVIVNALRKLESAGVIESRSLGMKGTRIKIINPYLMEEIAKVEL